ncbi:MAG: hypothetical protein WCD43_16895 [Candidatus Acidiferrales bacterium]
MKIYAQHDAEGTIRSLITFDGPEGSAMMLGQKPGVLFSELEGLKFKSGTPTAEELRALAATHRISGASQKRTLEKK